MEKRFFHLLLDKQKSYGVWSLSNNSCENYDAVAFAGKRTGINFENKSGADEIFKSLLDEHNIEYSICEYEQLDFAPGQFMSRIARPYISRKTGKELTQVSKTGFEKDLLLSRGRLKSYINRLLQICETVHPAQENFGCYGFEIRNLIILCCSEVELQFKGICKANGEKKAARMSDFYILKDILKLDSYELLFPAFPECEPIKPFQNWDKNQASKSLHWYDAYNALKHDDENNFISATLINALKSISAVYILLYAQYGANGVADLSRSISEIFYLNQVPEWNYSECLIHISANDSDTMMESVSAFHKRPSIQGFFRKS